jgi:hypothetical protein
MNKLRNVIVFATLINCVSADEPVVDETESDVIVAEALSASQFNAAKTATSAIGAASLSSNSAAIQTLISTANGQAMFAVIVRCAVSSGQSVTATGPGGPIVFAGQMGVASAWRLAVPTLANKRWTTACVMARTNLFGVTSQVSLRHDTYLPLISSAVERAAYPVAVGAFYGDLFQAAPKTYACGAVAWPPGSDPLVECARTINGSTTVCGFTWTGLCPATLGPCVDKIAPFGLCRGDITQHLEVATLFIQ